MTANRRRVSLGLFLCGLVTFGAVYSGQSLLPVLATAWRITPGEASLTVSVTTGALAVFVIPASLLADRLGRSRAMAASVLAGSVLTLAGAASKSYPMLLVLRGLAGVAFAGVVAVAMGYLAEQVPAGQLGSAAGLYVAGNSVGGMVGRVLSATCGDLLGWRAALAIAGLLALVGAFAAVRILPASAPHADRPPAPLWPLLKQNLSDLVLLRLCLIGGLAISAFVTAYNFLGFRLLAAPFALPATLVGLIFLTYVAGTAGSAICGRLTDRFPHRYVLLMTAAVAALAAVLTLPDSLPLILIGLIALTAGFFASNSAATAAVSLRSPGGAALAGGLYTFGYYLGASVGGTVGGMVYGAAGWTATAWYIAALFLAAGLLGLTIRVGSATSSRQREPAAVTGRTMPE
ncbi:MFS transporter [Fodinicola feengrottensis]|uniref:MFS transporter n=1 Tax=Fodinicola feengrottensis TaxID=435914 RepID=A0ABN2HQN8_9ACTN